MKIVGGVYTETCVSPHWDAIFGSGGRAAAAICKLTSDVELYAYATDAWADEVKAAFSKFDFQLRLTSSADDYSFSYFHPLSIPTVHSSTASSNSNPPIAVAGPVVVRFGFIEGDAQVTGDTVIYDPQNNPPVRFTKNNSRANRLAYVLNRSQLRGLTGIDSVEGAKRLLSEENAEVVVIKSGFLGVQVVTISNETVIPAYFSDRVFKIGSGDVFTATFAYYWAVRGLSPEVAADKASRSVAWYCNTSSLPVPDADDLVSLKPIPTGTPGKLYLAAPFFTIAQRWLVEEAREALETIGVPVFSPLHEIGFGPSQVVALEDIKGLEECVAVLSVCDGRDLGTIFESGWGRSRGLEVTCFAERLGNYERTMLTGTGCKIVEDFASAIYRAAWSTLA